MLTVTLSKTAITVFHRHNVRADELATHAANWAIDTHRANGAHGFDEFFGSLYHLNAEDEPEHPDYFKDPENGKEAYQHNGPLGTSGQACYLSPLNPRKENPNGDRILRQDPDVHPT